MLNPKYYQVPKVTTRKKQTVKPEWNSEVNDTTKFKLTSQELLHKRIMNTSKNLEYVKTNKIVEKKQTEIAKKLKERDKSHTRSSSFNQNVPIINDISNYINKYRIDSTTLSAKKLLPNQSFSKTNTGRLQINQVKNTDINASLNKTSTDSFNIRFNERDKRLAYGISLVRSMSETSNSRNTTFNGSISRISNKSSTLITSSSKDKHKESKPEVIKMQKNCLFIRTKVTRKNNEKPKEKNDFNLTLEDPIDIEYNTIVKNKEINSIRTLPTYKEETVNTIKYEDYSNYNEKENKFKTEKIEVKQSLDDCLSRLNRLMENSNFTNNVKQEETNVDYYNSNYDKNNQYDYSKIRSTIANDFNKYNNLMKNEEMQEEEEPEQSLNSSNAMNTFQDSQSQVYTFSNNEPQIIKNKADLKNISYLKTILKSTNQTIKNLNNKFSN